MSLTAEKYTVEQVLRQMSREEAFELWQSLPAPTEGEVQVNAVLQALVAQRYHCVACRNTPALGLED